VQGFRDAPERTRTSTDLKVHKALNLARLPIPPQARGAASIALGRAPLGGVPPPWTVDGRRAGGGTTHLESVLGPRYISEHMFDVTPVTGPNEQGAGGWT
jgi:hypothetical protein